MYLHQTQTQSETFINGNLFFMRLESSQITQVSAHHFKLLSWEKWTQHEKLRLIKAIELKLTEVELDSFFLRVWTDKNQLKCEKVRFFYGMSEINSKWVIFTFFYVHKKKILGSRKFSTSGFWWIYMFWNVLNTIWPFLENVCLSVGLSVCLYASEILWALYLKN